MSVVQIAEVRQRNAVDPLVSRGLGMFTDRSMAEQARQSFYREAWKVILSSDFTESPWFSIAMRNAVVTQGFDRWAVDDINGPAPLFYVETQGLWNQVPASLSGFKFTMEGSWSPS